VTELRTVAAAGRLTEMTCRCGGRLREVRRLVVPVEEPRPHRQKRIRKKWRKRWEREHGSMVSLSAALSAARGPSYLCDVCGRTEGFYAAVGRNLISVQPMPPAAVLTFDRDEVSTVILDGVDEADKPP